MSTELTTKSSFQEDVVTEEKKTVPEINDVDFFNTILQPGQKTFTRLRPVLVAVFAKLSN